MSLCLTEFIDFIVKESWFLLHILKHLLKGFIITQGCLDLIF